MTRIDIRLEEEVKKKLEVIAKTDNRSITKEIIQLIEDRYKYLEGSK